MLEEIEQFECQLNRVKEKIKKEPKHIMWKDLKDADKFQRLRPGRKQLMDTVRMIAYRAETAMAEMFEMSHH